MTHDLKWDDSTVIFVWDVPLDRMPKGGEATLRNTGKWSWTEVTKYGTVITYNTVHVDKKKEA